MRWPTTALTRRLGYDRLGQCHRPTALANPRLGRCDLVTMKYRPLGCTGLNVSVLGFGASPLGGAFRAIDENDGVRAVQTALDLGINFIDTAPYYGATRSEAILGKALRSVARERYYLATKVGQYGEGEFDFSAGRVIRSWEESCRRLGVEYIDLLQCHDIEFADIEQIVNETLPALARLREEGRIGHIGITGLTLTALRRVIERSPSGLIETALSFCRYTLNDTALATLLPYLAEKEVGVINASPTGMGLLTERGVPAWHPATPAMIATGRQAVEFCQSRGADIVKLAIQFCVAQSEIATTLVGSANPENMRRNIAAAEEPLDHELLAAVRGILQPIQNHNFTRGRPENRDPLVP